MSCTSTISLLTSTHKQPKRHSKKATPATRGIQSATGSHPTPVAAFHLEHSTCKHSTTRSP